MRWTRDEMRDERDGGGWTDVLSCLLCLLLSFAFALAVGVGWSGGSTWFRAMVVIFPPFRHIRSFRCALALCFACHDHEIRPPAY